MKRSRVHLSVCPYVCPINRQQQMRPAGLLLSALRAGDVDRRLPASTTRSTCRRALQHGTAARRSAANEGSVVLAAERRG